VPPQQPLNTRSGGRAPVPAAGNLEGGRRPVDDRVAGTDWKPRSGKNTAGSTTDWSAPPDRSTRAARVPWEAADWVAHGRRPTGLQLQIPRGSAAGDRLPDREAFAGMYKGTSSIIPGYLGTMRRSGDVRQKQPPPLASMEGRQVSPADHSKWSPGSPPHLEGTIAGHRQGTEQAPPCSIPGGGGGGVASYMDFTDRPKGVPEEGQVNGAYDGKRGPTVVCPGVPGGQDAVTGLGDAETYIWSTFERSGSWDKGR